MKVTDAVCYLESFGSCEIIVKKHYSDFTTP